MRLRGAFGSKRAIDPKGHRILGLSLESGEAILAPKGHSTLLSANGGGKTTRGAMPWLCSLAASEPEKAILVLDSKNGEIAIQAAGMLAAWGRKVVVIDDMGVWPVLAPYRTTLNPFGAIIAAALRDPRDVIFPMETVTHTLIEEPKDDQKNRYWRGWPQKLIAFGTRALLKRDPHAATPGAVATLLGDQDMLKSFVEIEAEEDHGALGMMARTILAMTQHEHWPQHVEEAERSLMLFGPGTRLHDAGESATTTHEDLIREGAIVFLVGPQAYMTRLGAYYALHILAFCDALYQGAGILRILADEATNSPLKLLVDNLTTVRAFGGEVHLIAQSRSEIIRKFGEQETRTIEENAIVKQWFGFSSFEEAERVSKAMGDEHAVASGLSGDSDGLKSQANLSLIKQRRMTPAELMAMPPEQQLLHIKGVGFILAGTLSQAQVEPACYELAENPLEGGRLPPDPKIKLAVSRRRA
ncbi:MAG: TraM recognition domain-containing protein [Pseudomonadota bacterium]